MGVVEELASAREAFERREWAAAYEALTGADADGRLDSDDLARWGTAAFLLGRWHDAVRTLQRAHTAYLADGDRTSAARCAFHIGMTLRFHRESAAAAGWFARGLRLVEAEPEPCAERAYFLVPQVFERAHAGDIAGSVATAAEIHRVGVATGNPDLMAFGLHNQGRGLVALGRAAEGLALMDEAMAWVGSAEVSPAFSGMVYCSTIEACQEVREFERVRQWTSALTRWCESQPDLVPFTGQWAVHRGQLLRLEGALDAALEELQRACERYDLVGEPYAAGLAMYERGEVLRERGAYAQAEAAYREAGARGHDPHPGLALLWVAQGRLEPAVAAVDRLSAETETVTRRAVVLPAVVQIRLAAGDAAGARAAAEELASVAESLGCLAARADAAVARGSVALAEGQAGAALGPLREAVRLWDAAGAPLEAARTRLELARACQALGDVEAGRLEAEAASRVFRERGSAPAAAEAAALLGESVGAGGLTAREVEVLRLVARGRSNPQIAAELVLSEKTVARHLSNIFTKLDVPSRTAAAAFAFEHRLV